jgi:glycerophosphoryl diester phosphodiesterase
MRLSLLSPLDRLIAPPPNADRVAFLGAQPYAHRGLHGGSIVENSRAAFSGAIAKGLGIELDVQAALGGDAYVFHDEQLDRLTGQSGMIAEKVGAELELIKLKGTEETIPSLAVILQLIAGRAPILIEVKTKSRSVGTLCLAVRRALEGYRGQFAVMSFNPEVGRWFHEHAPRIVRGLVVTEENNRGIKGRIERHLSLWRARPDFLAYDIRDLPAAFPAGQRGRGLKILTWTVRTVEQESLALAYADEMIFERPSLAQ